MSGAQLPLDLGHRPALGPVDFLTAPCNAGAVSWLERWPDWPAPALVVYGPAGCGKTHLAHLFAARSGALLLPAAALTPADPPRLLERAPAVAVEDADGGVDEVALFHLWNLCKETGRRLLVTAARPPALWGIGLPDLASRMKASLAVEIGPPDDELLAALLVKLFADRQVKVSEGVVAYLLGRMERSFAAARTVVDSLDRAALAQGRAVTVPLARSVLEGSGEEDSTQGELEFP